jgi:nitrite reductase/ring-hydroxylating ferredoxin subunit
MMGADMATWTDGGSRGSLDEERCGDSTRDAGCGGCETGSTRREFLRDGALVIALLAASKVPLSALSPVGYGRGVGRGSVGVVYDIPPADGATIDRDNEVILVRWEGRIYAFWLSCPHQRTVLRWREEDGRFQCPKHRSRYQPDGAFISGRATRGMDRYAVQLRDGRIEVDTATLYRDDREPEAWAGAVVVLPSSENERREP